MSEQTGLWIYCVVENRGKLPFEAAGIHETSPVFAVAHGDFAMLVSKEPLKKYPLVRDTLIAHQRINEQAMQAGTVLPVRFCTMAENEEQIVKEVLGNEEKISEFKRAQVFVKGKNEFGLRARWKNLGQVFQEIGEENEKVKMAKEKAGGQKGEGLRMSLIEVGHLVQEGLEEKKTAVEKALTKDLIPLAVQYKKNNVLGDANILNAAFLVDEKKQAEFDRAVNTLVGGQEDKIQFKYVGPIPPFNFVEIVIHFNGKKGA